MTPRTTDGIQRPYCLRCYAHLERSRSASVVCASCGYVNVRADQRLYWTREPKLIETEWLAKVGILLLLGALFWAMLAGMQMQFGMGQGYAIGFLIVIGAILWETASKITRKKPYFRATLLWSVLPLILATPFVLGLLWPSAVPWKGRLIVGTIALFLITLSFSVRWIAAHLERWRERRILSAQG